MVKKKNPWAVGNTDPVKDILDLAANFNKPHKFTPEEWEAMTPKERNQEALKRLRDYNEGFKPAYSYWDPTELYLKPDEYKDLLNTVKRNEYDWALNPIDGELQIGDIKIKKREEDNGQKGTK